MIATCWIPWKAPPVACCTLSCTAIGSNSSMCLGRNFELESVWQVDPRSSMFWYVLHSSKGEFYNSYIRLEDFYGVAAKTCKLRHGFCLQFPRNKGWEHPKKSGVEAGYGLSVDTTTSSHQGEVRKFSQFSCASCPTTAWWTSAPWAVASMPFTPSWLLGWSGMRGWELRGWEMLVKVSLKRPVKFQDWTENLSLFDLFDAFDEFKYVEINYV